MQLEVSVLSNPGGRERNEDACGFWTGGGGCFCVVSDGAGGHGGGDIASKLAVRMILSSFQDAPACTGPAIDAALRAAHAAIVSQQGVLERSAAMRATATVLAIDTVRHTAVWGHVGDTRLYCFRAGRVIAQTKDHSVVQKMVDAGLPRAERAAGVRAAQPAVRGARPRRGLRVDGRGGAASPSRAATCSCCAPTDSGSTSTRPRWRKRSPARDSPAEWLRRMEQDVVRNGREGQDNFSAVAVWCTETAPASSR